VTAIGASHDRKMMENMVLSKAFSLEFDRKLENGQSDFSMNEVLLVCAVQCGLCACY
jgi:hypothetical protein